MVNRLKRSTILRYPLQLTMGSPADSDSDESITQITNRGNKLRRKARYVHEGQLAPPSGPVVYKRVSGLSKLAPRALACTLSRRYTNSSISASSMPVSIVK